MARIHTLTIRIEGPGLEAYDSIEQLSSTNNKVKSDIQGKMSYIEDVVNDELPDGFYCKIDE